MMRVSTIHLIFDEKDGYDEFYQLIINDYDISIWQGGVLIKKISIKNMIQLAVSQAEELSASQLTMLRYS